MPVNRKMFAEIHELISAFPELHNQHYWEEDDAEATGSCGTTRCIAGWATWLGAKEHGLLNRKREGTTASVRDALADRLGLCMDDFEDDTYLCGAARTDYAPLGAALLGLTGDQARSLFHDMNGKRVQARVKSYAETGADLSESEIDSFAD
jgi:hypothetical protein